MPNQPSSSHTDILKTVFQQAHNLKLEERDAKWTDEEIRALDQILGLLPKALVSDNDNLHAFIRQKEYTGDYAGAPGGGMHQSSDKKDYVVLYDKGMYNSQGTLDMGQFANTLIHEISHSFDDELEGPYQSWLALSGWFQENGQWFPTRDTGFANEYARQHPKEDFAESFTLYILDPEKLQNVSPMKYNFMSTLCREVG